MPADQIVQIPFLLEGKNLQVDKIIIYCLSILAAVTVNAEGQAMMATTLGDIQKGAKDRFHFNPLFHLDIAGLLCFFIAGFGWSRAVRIETENFKHPRLYLIVSRFAGSFANLLLAGIIGSILWAMHAFGLEDQVFSIVISVNLMVFVGSFLPVPPLAGASIFSFLLPKRQNQTIRISSAVFPYLFVFLLGFLRFNNIGIFNDAIHPVVRRIFAFIAG